MRRSPAFQTIRSEGGLLPPDLLRRVLDPKEKLDGTRPEDYGLPQGERQNEVITPAWNRLRKHWAEFRAAARNLPSGEPGTGLTNDKWNLPLLRELGFGLLPTSAGPEIGGRVYAINRFFGPVPVHLVGCGLSLDHRAAGVRGAAVANPHGLVQEFVNRSSGHLWAIVANGLQLRILRDNQALSRQSFLEFNLEAMFSGELYSDFVLLWLVAHATRFAPGEADRPETCWLEQWTKLANEQGIRALGELRGGVERALQILGQGFTGHRKNTALRERLRDGQVPLADFHGQLLREIYRLIFLFVAEDRTLDDQSLLHPIDTSEAGRLKRDLYAAHYSTARLRELAARIKGSRHGDLWRQLQITVSALSGNARFASTREQLALPALGSFLWDPGSTAALNDAELTNYDFLEALRHLAFTRQGKVLRPVDYKNLGSEELGGVYESLLALTPQISADGSNFTFAEFSGNERKTSGSYYTPDSLVQCLLDSALDPVVEEAIKGKTGAEAEKAIRALKVCDPAVGSGHFLVGAAHRLARHLARVRAHAQGESEPSPLLYQHALRDVIGRCLYGVDLNPMAAELCRVSLWLEALEPGKPLSFLDHHIRVGNSLLGTTPELLAQGIPDAAFTPIEGDDKSFASALKKLNKVERTQFSLPLAAEDERPYGDLADKVTYLDSLDDSSISAVHEKEETYRRFNASGEYQQAKLLADAWCAAFVWKKRKDAPQAVTEDILRRLRKRVTDVPSQTLAEIHRLSREYQFFHWHLAFPEVIAKGGFDCVLGNPPWERVKVQDREWFARRHPDIANAANAAARRRLIESLRTQDPALHTQFVEAVRQAEGESHLMRDSGLLPQCGRGDINLYAVFAERMRLGLNARGRVGVVLPTGIATDDTTKFFFQDVVETKSLASLFDFENKGIFPAVDSRMKFCLFTSGRGVHPTAEMAEFVFFAHTPEELRDPERRVTLSAENIALLNPNTRTCPVFRSRTDAELTKAVYRRLPVLHAEDDGAPSGWSSYYLRLIDYSDHAESFVQATNACGEASPSPSNVPRLLPIYESKLFHAYDNRYATYRDPENVEPMNSHDKENPDVHVRTKFLFPAKEFEEIVKKYSYRRNWLLCVRELTNTTNERTVIAAALPRSPVFRNTTVVVGFAEDSAADCLLAQLNSLPFDYLARQSLSGTHLSFAFLKQLPCIPVSGYALPCSWSDGMQTLRDWVLPRVLELTYTAWNLEGFAQDCGWSGPPFRWDEERRFLLRCELDAAFFHLYLPAEANGDWRRAESETAEDLARLKASIPTPRDAVSYIMDTFPIVKRKDEEKWGEYRTKRIILEIYDALAESIRTGHPYQTLLDPPPADPRVAHEPRLMERPLLPALVPKGRRDVPDESRVLRPVKPDRDERYTNCVPRLDLKVAAGHFSDDQRPEFEEWVEVNASRALRKGMFVAQVVGRSMEPLIPDGAYCLFQFKAPLVKNDLVGLFQLHSAEDPESGGRFTVKRLKISEQRDPEEGLRRVVTLAPENAAFQPIPVEADDVKFVAEFLEVLRPLGNGEAED